MKTSKPHKLLADALREAKAQSIDHIIRSSNLKRYTRIRLKKAGCLSEIIRGWYLLTSPEGASGSTAWFGGFWAFLKQYLEERFGREGYCLNPESSLNIHTGDSVIPKQIIVIVNRPSNQIIDLPHDTSILLYHHDKTPIPKSMESFVGVNIFSLEEALCRLTPSYFIQKPLNVEIALKQIRNVTNISRILLENDLVNATHRLAGAFKFFGDEKKGEQIIQDMKATGRAVSSVNPFKKYEPCLSKNLLPSPYVGRIRAMWKTLREEVLENFPHPKKVFNKKTSLRVIEKISIEDAYHSLSIEGYQVTEELIKNIEEGKWDPEGNDFDKQQKNALAAKGYLDSFKEVVRSIKKYFDGNNPGTIVEEDLQTWYRELFSPMLQANLLKASNLAGYRNQPVYIKNSRHVPPGPGGVLDSMEILFELLKEEEEPAVRAVLGHYIFVYIHPYMDGNGRIGRFLMNFMLVSGGYNWTVIRSPNRSLYLDALEKINKKGNIKDFTNFIAGEMLYWKEIIE